MSTMGAALDKKIDMQSVREQFPTLAQNIGKHPLVYLDNGASTHKPLSVIERVARFYQKENSNVHRGIHTLSQTATDHFEGARAIVRQFINAKSDQEIIFTRGTTDSINLVASSFGSLLDEGDEVIISAMEHHSNIVPWQLLEQNRGIKLRVIPIDLNGELLLDELPKLINKRTKLLSITQLSNALGTTVPIKDVVNLAHQHHIKVLVDGAQAIAHQAVDVMDLDCDFYVFSGHKIFGPTGIGVLYGKQELLDQMPPYQSGGDMIKVVSFSGTSFNELPYKFEAGTPNIAGAIGLGEALMFVSSIGLESIALHEAKLLNYATDLAQQIDGLQIIGQAKSKASILSFLVKDAHASDIGTLLDQQGVAIRVGHHCAMPVMEFFGIDSTCRASLAFYNNKDDIDRFIAALDKALSILR